MSNQEKVYKLAGYLFPVAITSVFVFNVLGIIALILYWRLSLCAKNNYVKTLIIEIKSLSRMEEEVKSLIKICDSDYVESTGQ